MIDLKNETTYRPIHHDTLDWLNRLTIFSDGDVWIQEIHQSERDTISRMEFRGEACSITIPESLSLDDVYRIADKVLPIIGQGWDYEKTGEDLEAARNEIYEIVEGYVVSDDE